MVDIAQAIALVGLMLAVGGLIWKGGRQSRDIESSTRGVRELWDKHDELSAQMTQGFSDLNTGIHKVGLQVASLKGKLDKE